MDQLPKRPFAGLLSRSGTDKSVNRAFGRADTTSSLSASVSSLDIDDEKGPLGLTTLHEPQPPTKTVADIVFIHGLGGGSRKTWAYSSQPHHFWPRSWLPADNDFSDVRIHTFGYKADWGERRESILDIHDFAQSLLGALRNHPGIRRTDTRIIFVGHSMGGCVAKKAYILARQDPTAADLAGRVQSIFFLGTPHRGSDMASILENMLTMAWGKKPYVTDLTPNSASLTAINDAFRHYAPELRLWSFFETLPIRGAGTMSRIVVDRHSATLGYHNEEIAGLNADHRHVCKFGTPTDPNYTMLRNALLTAVDMARSAGKAESGPSRPGNRELGQPVVPSPLPLSSAEVTSRLRSFLAVQGSLEGDLATLQVLKQPGSCEWFTTKTCFASWRAGTAPPILWLVGRPAAGKSVLSSHVIEQLGPPHAYCSYFIFKHAKGAESTLSDCFRSLAFQMAMQDDSAKQALLQLSQDGLTWDQADDASVWRRLFTGCIFKLSGLTQHFWVIDGVDECPNFQALFTKKLLVSFPQELRLFATSRNLEEIERGLTSLIPNRARMHVLSDEDTVEDMRLFVTTSLMELGRPETAEDRDRMCDKIIQKSSGSFLWARLVLQEFQNAWTEEAMDAVLEEVPRDLFELYTRMVQSIEQDARKLDLAKSILTWVVLARRPLTVDELRVAVKLDINQTLQNAAKAIPDLSGQLVFVDQDNKVQMIHDTAREFLLTDAVDLPLSVHKKRDHTRLGSLLLGYLSSAVLKPLPAVAQQNPGRPRGFVKPAVAPPSLDTSLLQYACTFFSEHVSRATSADHQLMADLSNFLLANNVLSWIEHIAKSGDLTPLSRTATNLREYLKRRMKYVPPTDRSMQLVDGWVTDLIRVAAKFRAELLACPSSIHSLIPPLCPTDSVISRTFGRGDARPSPTSPALIVKGLPPGSWDDCLTRMDFQKNQTTALSHGDRFFAIGLSTGQILLYDPTSLQVLRRCLHPERVNILEFSPEDLLLASCGVKQLVIWDTKTCTMLHSFPLPPSPILAITFLGSDEVLGVFKSCTLTKWNLETEESESISWKGAFEGYPSPTTIPPDPPTRASFVTTPDGVLLAVGYRIHPIVIWNALEFQPLGSCMPDFTNNGINAMVFNPNPEIPALLVSFQDGSLCVFDYLTMELQVSRPDVYASTVACSPDGRTVVIGSNQGIIEVFELEQVRNGAIITLSIIYRSNHPLDEAIRRVAFSADGLRFVDIRGRQSRVWAPAALVRQSASERESSIGSSEAETAMLFPPRPSHRELHAANDPKISCAPILLAHGKLAIAGKSNGDVVLFSAAGAEEIGLLYQHPHGAPTVCLVLVESRNRVISADDAARILVADFETPLAKVASPADLTKPSIVLDRRFEGAVVRMVVNPAGDRLLVSGRYTDQLWEIPSGETFVAGGPTKSTSSNLAALTTLLPPRPTSPVPGASSTPGEDRVARSGPRSAFQHPTNPEWLVVVTRDIARVYSWTDFTELTSPEGIHLAREPPALNSQALSSLPHTTTLSWDHVATSYAVGPNLVAEHFKPSPSSSPRIYLWPAAAFDPSSQAGVARPAIEPNLDAVSPAVLQVLGISGPSTLLFLDIKLWVCSVELQSVVPSPSAGVAFRSSGFRSTASSSPSSNTSSLAFSTRPTSTSTRLTPPSVAEPTTAHAKRHFFALSEWRTGNRNGELRCAVAVNPPPPVSSARAHGGGSGARDVAAFAAGSRLVVVHGGLGFAESVVAAAAGIDTLPGGLQVGEGGLARRDLWRVVSGSMHRRSSNW